MNNFRMSEMENVFDDHPSLSASLESIEDRHHRPALFGLPSQHSGFKSEADGEISDAEDDLSNSEPWSPPGLSKSKRASSGWYRHDPYGDGDRFSLKPSISPSMSRRTSPEYQSATEDFDGDITLQPNGLPVGVPDDPAQTFEDADDGVTETPTNYIRFALKAEVQHREPFVAFFNFLRGKIDSMTSSRSSTILTVILSLLSLIVVRLVLISPSPPPAPDLVKLSTLARSFEPLVIYSENGYAQITALQDTSVAVWDLGESVRLANMTSAPIIVETLDNLSENLKVLGLELSRFFAEVDSDVDSILLVMDWAMRELAQIDSSQTTGLTNTITDNIHGVVSRLGGVDRSGRTTALGRLVTDLCGASTTQRALDALTRTFQEFLAVLEEAINNELAHSAALFALFESIDGQFLNLQRTVVRESDNQERLESDLLTSLWGRVFGVNPILRRKYEKNKQLLQGVRQRTVANKHLIMEHHNRLQTLKASLEALRRRLVSPVVRRNDSTSVDSESLVEKQIRGLEGTYNYLQGVREKQKSKLMEMVYGAGTRKTTIVGGMEQFGIDGR